MERVSVWALLLQVAFAPSGSVCELLSPSEVEQLFIC